MKVELEFISCSERLPEESDKYLCLMDYKDIYTYHFSKKHSLFNTYDFQSPEEATETSTHNNVTHWAKLPDLTESSEEAEIAKLGSLIASGGEVKTALEQQRRRDMFERVILVESNKNAIHFDFDDWTTMDPNEYARLKNLTEMYLKAADKFARGEK